jgi:S1-C subfamily serine protease
MYDLDASFILDESSEASTTSGVTASMPDLVPPDDRDLLDAYSRAVIDVVDRIGPAVVRLDVRARSDSSRGGSGSGVVVAPDGRTRTSHWCGRIPPSPCRRRCSEIPRH